MFTRDSARGILRRFLVLVLSGLFATSLFGQELRRAEAPRHVMYIDEHGQVKCEAVSHDQLASRFDIRLKESNANQPSAQIEFATFQVNFTDFSTEAQAAFQRAVDIWSTLLSSQATIVIDAEFAALGANVLGQAGANGFTANFQNTPLFDVFYPVALADAIAGVDLDPGTADIGSQFSNTFNFYFGLDGNPPANQIDFVTVVLHEIGHGLGFIDSFFVNQAGVGSTGLAVIGQNLSLPVIFDEFIVNGAGLNLNDENSFANDSMALGNEITSDDVFFNGPRTMAANGAAPARIFAPSPYDPGSSIGHLDDNTFPNGSVNALMTSAVGFGEAHQTPGPVGLAMFEDIGWQLTPPSLNLPQFGNGNGLTSDIVVFNPSATQTASVEVVFWDPAGAELDGGAFLNSFPGAEGVSPSAFVLGPLASTVLSTNGTSVVEGSVTVVSDNPVAAVIRFALQGAGVAGVGTSDPELAVLAPVRRAGGLSTGVAVRNPGGSEIVVDLTLKNQAGQVVNGGTAMRTIAPQGRFSQFIEQIFPQANTGNFQGTICVEARTGTVAVIAIELDFGNGIFTTLPVTPIR